MLPPHKPLAAAHGGSLTRATTCGGDAVEPHEGIETRGSTSQDPFQLKGDKPSGSKVFYSGRKERSK